MSPQPEPEYHAITEHSNCLHNATKHFDDTIPIVPRPPSSLTTETEPAARPKDLAITEHSNCLHSATNHFDDTNPIVPRPPSSLTIEYEPATRAQIPPNH